MRGVFHVLTTPFDEDERLDEPGLRRLVSAAVEAGVAGLTVLGVTGEAHKLTATEQRRVLELVAEEADGVKIVVGASRDGAVPAIEAARVAVEHGADAVMMTPPRFMAAGPAMTAFFQRVSAAVDVPIVFQDYPVISGVNVTPEDIIALTKAIPAITAVKLESYPTGRRMAGVLADADIPMLGGLGASYLLQELEAGATGTMTGFPFPAILVDICERWDAGDRAAAAELCRRYLPAFVLDGQPVLGLAFRKHALVRRGFIESATVRSPGTMLSQSEAAGADEMLSALGLVS